MIFKIKKGKLINKYEVKAITYPPTLEEPVDTVPYTSFIDQYGTEYSNCCWMCGEPQGLLKPGYLCPTCAWGGNDCLEYFFEKKILDNDTTVLINQFKEIKFLECQKCHMQFDNYSSCPLCHKCLKDNNMIDIELYEFTNEVVNE